MQVGESEHNPLVVGISTERSMLPASFSADLSAFFISCSINAEEFSKLAMIRMLGQPPGTLTSYTDALKIYLVCENIS